MSAFPCGDKGWSVASVIVAFLDITTFHVVVFISHDENSTMK